MKSVNFFLVIAALFLSANIGFAQSDKDNARAIKATDKIDNALKSANPELALSEAQRTQIIAMQLDSKKELIAFSENNADEGAIKTKSKELRKALRGKIAEVLTPEQAQAQKDARKSSKGTKGKGAAKADRPKGKKQKPAVKQMTAAEANEINAAASDKDKSKAEKATEKLNANLIAADANLALSADQKKQINILNLKRQVERSKMKDAGLSKEEIKVKGKDLSKSNRGIINSILTKEQNAALKAAKALKKK